jgi:hypothetical protein
MLSRTMKLAVLWGVAIIAIAVVAAMPPIAQPTEYHSFSDARTLLGIPHFWNVMSNVPFLLVGVLGLIEVVRGRYQGGLPSLRWIYGVFFVGIASVCLGSGYYHWAPSNQTLAWDRLPMAVAFTAFVSIVLAEHINERIAKLVLVPLIAVGVFSVWYWDYTEALGRGDLRLYGLVQFLSLMLIALTFWLFPSRLSGIGYLWAMFGGYALAKVLEELDPVIYAAGNVMSGHALKHMAAAAGMFCFLLALRKRVVTRDA